VKSKRSFSLTAGQLATRDTTEPIIRDTYDQSR
jgi:hypothetical protein